MPVIATALVAGGLPAFALSFDEVIVTTFTAGAQNTPPPWIFGNMRLTRDTGVLRSSAGGPTRDARAAVLAA